jgi:hypothetical protein
MDMVYNIGLMVPITRATGSWTKLKAKVRFGTLKETFIEVNLKMIWPTAMENTLILMVLNTRENFMMTYKKVTVKKNGLMELSILDPTRMVWNMDMEFISGQMEVDIKVIGTKIKFPNSESTFGMMVGHIQEIGWIIICMVMECINGQMVENTKVSI